MCEFSFAFDDTEEFGIGGQVGDDLYWRAYGRQFERDGGYFAGDDFIVIDTRTNRIVVIIRDIWG